MRTRWTARLAAMAVGLGGALGGAARAEPMEFLARAFAPVVRQDTANDQDFLAAFDFDGDWDGGNNWENQDDFPLEAVVYWTGIETPSHVFLTYAWFHPRDWANWQRWGNLIGKSGAHENDMEGAWLVLEKDGDRVWPVVMETIFHREFRKYRIDPRYVPRDGVGLQERAVSFEGTHPVVEVESHGHGVQAWGREDFPGGDGVIYRVGDVAEVPEHDDDRDVSYALVRIEDSLWPRRFDTGEGETFATTDVFEGVRFGYAFRGYDYGKHKAHAPWGWTDESTDLPRGTHFLDPARFLVEHFHAPVPVGRDYRVHPFRGASHPRLSCVPSDTTVSDEAAGGGLFGN